MDQKLLDKLEGLIDRLREVTERMAAPEIHAAPDKYRELTKEHAQLSPLAEKFTKYKAILAQIESNQELLQGQDPDLAEMARVENEELEEDGNGLEREIRLLLLPRDPADEKNVILEIRAGTGGEEAALFAADLFRMYNRYVDEQGWRLETLSLSGTGKGGIKEVIGLIEGHAAYSRLKFESGVHRVQRVPQTEAQGRIHTSAVTVAILPEASEVDVKLEDRELRIDVFRSSGPGGQSVNTTDSAVRITHVPSGLVVTCQDEKSQHKNKAKAMKILKSRLLDQEREKQQKERSQSRKSQIGTGDRSERIRTYNFPQGRVTDHRIGLTLYQLQDVLEGNLDLLIPEIQAHFQAQALHQE